MISVIGKEESIVRMGEDAGYQHFLPFPQCFKRPFSRSENRMPIHIRILQENKNESMKVGKVESIVWVGEGVVASIFSHFHSASKGLFLWSENGLPKHIKIVRKKKKGQRQSKKVGKVESTVRMGENAGYQHFLPFPQCLKRHLSLERE